MGGEAVAEGVGVHVLEAGAFGVAFDDLREFDPELFTTLTNNVLRVTVTAEYADTVCLDFDEIEYDVVQQTRHYRGLGLV